MTNFTVFLVLITIVCFLLIIVVMVQNPKGGGLSSSFGANTNMGGVQKTTDFLDKSTWTLATLLIVLILMSSLSFPTLTGGSNSKLIEAPATTSDKPATKDAAKPMETAPATPVKK